MLIVLIVGLTSFAQAKPLDEKTPEGWYTLSDDAQWMEYYWLYQEYTYMLEKYNRLKSIDLEKEDLIITYEKKIEQLKSYIPRYGLGLYITGGLDKTLEADVFCGIDFYIYALKGRLFFPLGAYVKIYDELGGGLKVGIGFNW